MEDFTTSGCLDIFYNSRMVDVSKILHFYNCSIFNCDHMQKKFQPLQKIVQGCLKGGSGAFVEFITHNL